MSVHGHDDRPAKPVSALGFEEMAASFALRGEADAEAVIDTFCADAIRRHCLQDATAWQRVKFRARLLRAMQPVQPPDISTPNRRADMTQAASLPPVQPIAAPVEDRRAASRTSTVLLIGKIHDGRTTTACLVLNLSERGLMARVGFDSQAGQRVAVEMRGLALASATVRWVSGSRIGLEFDHRQNLNPVFCLMSDDGLVARPPRFDVSLEAVLRIDGRPIPVHVVNISPGGVRLATDTLIERGQAAQITVPGRDFNLFGTVRWVAGGELGFHFSTPLPLSVLRDCLHD